MPVRHFINAVKCLINRFVYPNLDVDGRKLTAIYLILNGISRITLTPIVALDFVNDRYYGMAAVILGVLIVITSFKGYNRTALGRITALFGASLLIAWGFDLTYRANAFWSMQILGFVLFREAIRR